MKTIRLTLFVFILSGFSIIDAQPTIDYSDPKEVAQKFLEYFYKGQWFDAAKFCGAGDCQKQIEIMMTKMALDDISIEEGSCHAIVDSVVLYNAQKGTIYFSKKCSSIDKAQLKKLDIIRKDDKWLVDYLFKRDKYL